MDETLEERINALEEEVNYLKEQVSSLNALLLENLQQGKIIDPKNLLSEEEQ